MLFGRRKPGFAKEVELKPEDITDEFSDRNDPAMQRDSNPKSEKAEMARRAEAVMKGEKPGEGENAEKGQEQEKMDIFDYLQTMPEVEDIFEPSEKEPEGENTEEQEPPKPEEVLAAFIRDRSGHAALTAKSALAAEEENLEEILKAMEENESCRDIKTVKGNKDIYYYSDEIMANNYAMIAMLVVEKDIPRTIVQMVRFNCKTYPAPTPVYYFMRSPYLMEKEQIEAAIQEIKANPEYEDIQTLTSFNDVLYLYSLKEMSTRYAKALADGQEAGEADF